MDAATVVLTRGPGGLSVLEESWTSRWWRRR